MVVASPVVASRGRAICTALVLCFSSGVAAQPVSDFSLEVTPPLPDPVAPNGQGELQFTIANLGPDATGGNDLSLVVASSAQYSSISGVFDVYFSLTVGSASCRLLPTILEPPPGGQVGLAYLLFPGVVVPGESVSCSMAYALDPVSPSKIRQVAWEVRSFASTDPNPDNNSVSLVFNVGQPELPMPVPTMPPWAWLLLSGSFAVIGALSIRRNTLSRWSPTGRNGHGGTGAGFRAAAERQAQAEAG
jgi:hypothetical protein